MAQVCQEKGGKLTSQANVQTYKAQLNERFAPMTEEHRPLF